MPSILRFHLQGPVPDRPFRHADGLRARVYDWYRAVEPEAAGAVHGANAPKPFSIGPLLPLDERAAPGLEAAHAVDLALIADRLVGPLAKAIAADGGSIRLGSDDFAIRKVEREASTTWQELLEPPERSVRSLAFRFLTPMTHHATGELRKAVPLPIPEMSIGNWMRRWNAARPYCADEAPPEAPAWLADLAAERLALGRLKGATREVMVGRERRFVGFEGAATFVVLRPDQVPAEAHRWLAALARFATYCGTGVETMRGMGQTDLTSDEI